jgi:hypothetical protein
MACFTITYFEPETGRIVQVSDLYADAEIAMNQPAGCAFLPGDHDAGTIYIAEGAPTPRPVVPPMAGNPYDLSLLPEGTVLVVTDEVGVSTEVPAQDERLVLTDPGTYRVRSVSPFPWIDFAAEVTV